MKLALVGGSTSVSLLVFIQNSSSTTGAGLTGLVYNSASLTAYYARPGAAATSITLATQTVNGAYSSGGFVEVDAANMPGVYRFDIPNAALAAGVNSVVAMLKGATNMAPLLLEIQIAPLPTLTPQEVRDAMKLTPTVGGGASGSVDYLLAAIAGDVEAIFSDTDEVIPAQIAALNNLSAAQVNAEVVDALTVDVIADSVATDGSRPTIAQALLMISRFLMERSVSSTTMTVKKEDGSTSSMTFTLNSASAPTSITRAS